MEENRTGNTFNPLADKVNEKSYAGGGAAGTADVMDIPEPAFQPPPLDLDGGTPLPDDGKKAKEKSEKKASEPFNQEMNELSDPDKKKAAEQAAAFAMTAYKGLHTWGNSMIRISDRKINKLQAEGEIDLRVPVPYGDHGMVALGEFINEYNAQAGEVLSVSPEFEDAVMPPLTRVLAKRGMGMTDENFLMFMFGQDIIQKGSIVVSMKRTTRDILAFAKEQTAAGRFGGREANMSVPQTQPASQPDVVEAPVIQMQPTTLQDKALHNVQVANTGEGNALPVYGDPNKLNNINKVMEIEVKERQRQERIRKQLDKSNGVPKPRRKKNAVPGPKKRGPKPGSKKGGSAKSNPTPTAK